MMVTVSRHSAGNHQPNGMANGGGFDPPPSTMAAQLINDLSATNRNQLHRPNEQDELKAIMLEVSNAENSIAEFANPNAKLEHKHKLIYVLSRTILERFTNDDPFMDHGRVASEASDALDVFMGIVKETPDVLDYRLGPNSILQGRGQESLWIWLFPRILALLGRRHCEILTEKIKDFFYVSFQAVAQSPKLWNMPAFFFYYLKECVVTILGHLQNPSTMPRGYLVEIILPSDDISSLVSSYEKDEARSINNAGCTYLIKDAGIAIWQASNILSMLGDISMESAASHHATPAFQDYLAWMFDSFLTAHELQKRLRGNLQSHEICTKSEIMSFYAVHAILYSLQDQMSINIVRKGFALLSILSADLLGNPSSLSDNSIRHSLCSGLLKMASICKAHDSMRRVFALHLVPAIEITLLDEAARSDLGNDFKKSAMSLCQACRTHVPEDIVPEASDGFDSVQLDGEFELLGLELMRSADAPPCKRRRIRSESLLDEVISKLYPILGSQNATDLAGLNQVAEACYAELNDSDRCRAIEYLGMVPCAANNSLEITRDQDGTIHYSVCSACESLEHPDPPMSNDVAYQRVGQDAIQILASIVKSPAFKDCRKPRVLAMITLKKFTVHFRNSEFIDLEKSPLGQWCVGSLVSSLRELRIASSRTLPGFLRASSVSPEIVRNNRLIAIGQLRSISEANIIHLQESCILAWAQVGRNLNDEELNMVLISLVEYLGHNNPIISGAAFNEILGLAKVREMMVERMFYPFWESVAIVAVRDLLVKPQASQLMADLLETSVTEFLKLTQSYTLPYLVFSGQVDVIKRISQARGDNQHWMAIMETSNLISILAKLMVQSVPDLEAYMISSLRAISSHFKDYDVIELIKFEPSGLALHLLKAIGDADESKKSRIRHAVNLLAKWAPSADNAQKKISPVGAFFEQHILGLVAQFSQVVNDARAEQSISEKKRCVKAIDEMIKIAKTFTRIARPQICACLHSALAQTELQANAFSAWDTMLINLEDEDVELMLESTFSSVIQHFKSFDELTRTKAEGTLQYLLKQRSRLIRNTIVNLPSLAQFPQLSDVELQLNKLRTPTDVGNSFQIFSRRVSHENSGVVAQALAELKDYLKLHQTFLQASAVSEQPDAVVGLLVRSILDSCVRFNQSNLDIAQLSAECIGLIGCLDPNRVEAVREHREIVVTSNFHDPGETTDFILFLLEEVIVKAFLSAIDTGVQGFLSFVMQQLLDRCGFSKVCVPIIHNGERGSTQDIWRKWMKLPGTVRDTLTPFLTSRYSVQERTKLEEIKYPIFHPETMPPDKLYSIWLKKFVMNLLLEPRNENAILIFEPLRRAIRIRDNSVASFLLPYVVLHIVVDGNDEQREQIGQELLRVLKYQITDESRVRRDDLKMCSEAVFRVIDYLSRWIQEFHLRVSSSKGHIEHQGEIKRVKSVLEMIPAEVISQRAVECKSYSRALFYWEQHIRQVREDINDTPTRNLLLERLQDIYTQIDEPDGIEGISAHLHVLDIDQQILGHRKAGRWTAAQSWYEIKLAEDPDNVDVQVNLLTCLKESGQHDVLLNYVEGMHTAAKTVSRLLPFAAEASWATGRWPALKKYTSLAPKDTGEDFNVSVGRALLALHGQDTGTFKSQVRSLREQIACSLSAATTPSFGACHDNMLKFHVLTELEMIAGTDDVAADRTKILESLNRRLEVIGAYLNDKQYLLGIRRAAMQLSSLKFTDDDIAAAWLTSARLARKGNAMHQSFNAVLRASQLGDKSATIEHARLLWKEGHPRKAIQNLQGAIDNNAFISYSRSAEITSFTGLDQTDQQNLLTARAHLLLAKWLDDAGQTQVLALRSQYQLAAKTYLSWEKGHYYLGRHYNKLLETEKGLAPEFQAESYLTGETAKLVIESYLRSLTYGTKYIYQTLPRILTLWLDLGTQVSQPVEGKYGNAKDFISRITTGRKEQLAALHNRFAKYIHRMPAYIFYTALPQIIARIAHPNPQVYQFLNQIIFKVVSSHPQQALWSLLAVSTSIQPERKIRGVEILTALRNNKKSAAGSGDIRAMIKSGERLTHELLMVCTTGEFQGSRTIFASITKDLNFRHKDCTPNPLAVPIGSVLTATLPTLTDKIKEHKAFSRDVVTISSFLDEVMILSSLQKPRKLTARGSDGKTYGLLCKPHDDLRKDQRLMEFNGMINRSLKRDAESSRRQLYIKTYAVTPLNEECGIIEWVDGLKTLRDILLSLYKSMGIIPNYREIELYCDEAIKGPDKIAFYTDKVLKNYPPIFHSWFVQQFPEPSAWFVSRLRYTRSCAVMSMVGTILGLGDRHGENILFEEGNGGTFHVDFNCLFDKGLTFVKPERVPFRLTHNMIDAMGIYGYEGPFRKSSELTLKLLRQHEETLMTILEAFVYDPTLDLIPKKTEKKKKEGSFHMPQTAQGVLDSIQRKIGGLLDGDTMPLGIEGQVDELIKRATNLQYLAGMYIGWCSFL